MGPRTKLALRGWIVLVCMSVWLAPSGVALAQNDDRLYELEPYDLVTLAGEDMPLKVLPIAMKRRASLKNKDPQDSLQVRLVEKPDQLYEVEWRHVVQVQLFEELLLAAAADLVKGENFDEAFEHYRVLERDHAEFPGVDAAIQSALRQEADWWSRKSQPAQALAVLNELHRRNPGYTGLRPALSGLADSLIDGEMRAGRPVAARVLVEDLGQKYPDDPIVLKWRQTLVDRAAELVARAAAERDAGKQREAQETVRAALAAWPSAEGETLAQELRTAYPVAVVGVETLPDGGASPGAPSWASWRASPLVRRMAAEPVRPNELGGEYAFPFGKLHVDGPVLRLELAEARWSDGRPIASQDMLATWLELMGQAGDSAAPNPWRELTGDLYAPSARELQIALRHPHPRPEALFRVAVAPWNASRDGAVAGNGPFVVQQRDQREWRYVESPAVHAEPPTPGKLRELFERRFDNPRDAIRALRAGDLAVIDRLAPALAAELIDSPDLRVVEYAFPTVHFLLPNLGRARMADARFRRALRSAINANDLAATPPLAGARPNWVRMLTGPFPIGYAYDRLAPATEYDPRRLAAWLAAGPVEKPPVLVLAHPPGEIARAACREIQRQWALGGQGVDVELRELAADSAPLDYDLLYVEWPAMEPLVDAFALCSHPALQARLGSVAQRALHGLAIAADMDAARGELVALHRSASFEAWVLPLFQATEHFACRRELQGVSDRPATLYRAVEAWRQTAPEVPENEAPREQAP